MSDFDLVLEENSEVDVQPKMKRNIDKVKESMFTAVLTIYQMLEHVMMIDCINLEGNNSHSYVKSFSHMYYIIIYSCYLLLYKEVKLYLSHMCYGM